ncbi:hypothetical protein LTR84_007099 [Exophiala bonariae]|uniref:C2H2-type domain-containing protein n=1 Tax=Exophiala bonariae TaxID=1690606 RepID=A0AAV9N0S6_9EURO|nr:hypothetical protein LTR84_007099 [Exophiala bonariae]
MSSLPSYNRQTPMSQTGLFDEMDQYEVMDYTSDPVKDDVYWARVHSFLKATSHSTISQRLGPNHPIATDYFRTSGSLHMQFCLIKLHYRFNVADNIPYNMIADFTYNTWHLFLQETQQQAIMLSCGDFPTEPAVQPQNNFIVERQAFIPSVAPLATCASRGPLTSAISAGHVSIPASDPNTEVESIQQASLIEDHASVAIPQTDLDDVDMPMTAAANPQSSRITVSKAEEEVWMLACSECGFWNRWRDLKSHMKHGQDITGLKVYRGVPEEERVWYGRDNQGNCYQGEMAVHEERKGKRQAPVGEPCAEGVQADRQARHQAYKAKKAGEESAEKAKAEEAATARSPLVVDAAPYQSSPFDPLTYQFS